MWKGSIHGMRCSVMSIYWPPATKYRPIRDKMLCILPFTERTLINAGDWNLVSDELDRYVTQTVHVLSKREKLWKKAMKLWELIDVWKANIADSDPGYSFFSRKWNM